jgi:hypothetical protein
MTLRPSCAQVAGWLFAAVGLGFAALSFSPGPFDFVNALLIPNANPSGPTSRVYAVVMGGVLCGFGTTIALICRSASTGAPSTVSALQTGVLAWFVVDTSGSLLHGAWPNAIFNLVVVMVLLPTIGGIRRQGTRRVAASPRA